MKLNKSDVFLVIKYIIVAFICFLILVLATNVYFYVHEGGHVLIGKYDALLNGYNASFNFSNHINGIFPFTYLPQRTTTSAHSSVGFVFGGMMLVLLVVGIISYFLYTITGKKHYWLFFALYIYHEFIGNFLCGTDNLFGQAYPVCISFIHNNWATLFHAAFLLLVFISIKPHLFKLMEEKLQFKA